MKPVGGGSKEAGHKTRGDKVYRTDPDFPCGLKKPCGSIAAMGQKLRRTLLAMKNTIRFLFALAPGLAAAQDAAPLAEVTQ